MAAKVKAKPATVGTAQPTDFEKMEEPLDEQELESLYAWVDSIPLSRPKRNISRDFSDGGNLNFISCIFIMKIIQKVQVLGTKLLCNFNIFDLNE